MTQTRRSPPRGPAGDSDDPTLQSLDLDGAVAVAERQEEEEPPPTLAERFTDWRRHYLPLPDEVVDEYLAEDEYVIHSDHPSFRAFLIQNVTQVALATVMLPVVFAFVRMDLEWWWILLMVLGLDLVLLVLAIKRLGDRYTSYVITNLRLIRVSGIISRKLASIPWTRMTGLGYRQKPIGRLMGFATIHIESANEESGLREFSDINDPATFHQLILDMTMSKAGPKPDKPTKGVRRTLRQRRRDARKAAEQAKLAAQKEAVEAGAGNGKTDGDADGNGGGEAGGSGDGPSGSGSGSGSSGPSGDAPPKAGDVTKAATRNPTPPRGTPIVRVNPPSSSSPSPSSSPAPPPAGRRTPGDPSRPRTRSASGAPLPRQRRGGPGEAPDDGRPAGDPSVDPSLGPSEGERPRARRRSPDGGPPRRPAGSRPTTGAGAADDPSVADLGGGGVVGEQPDRPADPGPPPAGRPAPRARSEGRRPEDGRPEGDADTGRPRRRPEPAGPRPEARAEPGPTPRSRAEAGPGVDPDHVPDPGAGAAPRDARPAAPPTPPRQRLAGPRRQAAEGPAGPARGEGPGVSGLSSGPGDTRRSRPPGNRPGSWAFPGGQRAPGDKPPAPGGPASGERPGSEPFLDRLRRDVDRLRATILRTGGGEVDPETGERVTARDAIGKVTRSPRGKASIRRPRFPSFGRSRPAPPSNRQLPSGSSSPTPPPPPSAPRRNPPRPTDGDESDDR